MLTVATGVAVRTLAVAVDAQAVATAVVASTRICCEEF